MIWTLALISTGIVGTVLSAKHWWGWLISALNEVLWEGYAFKTHDFALGVMAVVWCAALLRNALLTYTGHGFWWWARKVVRTRRSNEHRTRHSARS